MHAKHAFEMLNGIRIKVIMQSQQRNNRTSAKYKNIQEINEKQEKGRMKKKMTVRRE